MVLEKLNETINTQFSSVNIDYSRSYNHYKYHIHPILKLGLLFLLNIFAFLPKFISFRWIFLISEILISFMIDVKIFRIKGFLKFILLNFISILILFYFIDYSWKIAFEEFYHYFITMSILFIGAFIFTEITPPHEMIIAFRTIRIPKKMCIAITVAITFFPLLIKQIKLTTAYQESRGYRMHLWKLGPVLIPSLLNIIDLSMNLSLSMQSRGFEI